MRLHYTVSLWCACWSRATFRGIGCLTSLPHPLYWRLLHRFGKRHIVLTVEPFHRTPAICQFWYTRLSFSDLNFNSVVIDNVAMLPSIETCPGFEARAAFLCSSKALRGNSVNSAPVFREDVEIVPTIVDDSLLSSIRTASVSLPTRKCRHGWKWAAGRFRITATRGGYPTSGWAAKSSTVNQTSSGCCRTATALPTDWQAPEPDFLEGAR